MNFFPVFCSSSWASPLLFPHHPHPCFPFLVSHSLSLPTRVHFYLHSGSPRSAVTSCWVLGCCGWVACRYGPPPTQARLLVSGCRGSASFVVTTSSCVQRRALVPQPLRTWCIYGVYRRSVSRGVDRAQGWPWATARRNLFYLGILMGKNRM